MTDKILYFVTNQIWRSISRRKFDLEKNYFESMQSVMSHHLSIANS